MTKKKKKVNAREGRIGGRLNNVHISQEQLVETERQGWGMKSGIKGRQGGGEHTAGLEFKVSQRMLGWNNFEIGPRRV